MTRRPAGRRTPERKRGPAIRLPLPKKRQARHGDLTKFERAKEKERLRREIRGPEASE